MNIHLHLGEYGVTWAECSWDFLKVLGVKDPTPVLTSFGKRVTMERLIHRKEAGNRQETGKQAGRQTHGVRPKGWGAGQLLGKAGLMGASQHTLRKQARSR